MNPILASRRAPDLTSSCNRDHLKIIDATVIRQEGNDQTLDEYQVLRSQTNLAEQHHDYYTV